VITSDFLPTSLAWSSLAQFLSKDVKTSPTNRRRQDTTILIIETSLRWQGGIHKSS